MKRYIESLMCVALLLGPVGIASAGAIPIANSSFEDPPLAAGVFNFTIQDWTQGGGGSGGIGTWHPGSGSFDLSTLDGSQNAYLNGGSIAQQLTTGLVLGETYHLGALFGTNSSGGFAKGGSLELWAGGSVTDGIVTGGTLLGSLAVNDNDLVNGKFLPFQTDIVAPSSGPLGGALLSIRFASNGRESEIDNIQLSISSASVPEPPASMLLGLGAVILIGSYRWSAALRKAQSRTTDVAASS